jgi:hypothetical protein
MQYTVIGYYEDTNQRIAEHIEANSTIGAVVRAIQQIEDRQNIADEDERRYLRQSIQVVSVFYGLLTDLNESAYSSAAIDWPGLEIKE